MLQFQGTQRLLTTIANSVTTLKFRRHVLFPPLKLHVRCSIFVAATNYQG